MEEILLGCDLSHHNYPFERFSRSYDFYFIKATEGASYKDPKVEMIMNTIAACTNGSKPPFIGFYHYARPEINTALTEANHFCKVIRQLAPELNVLLALDFEGDAFETKDPDAWASEFCNYVGSELNHNIFLYCSASATKKLKNTLKRYPLWVAHYDKKQPKVDSDTDYIIWQFTSKPWDMDLFYGSRVDMHRYAVRYNNDN